MPWSVSTESTLKCVKLFCCTGMGMFNIYINIYIIIIIIIMNYLMKVISWYEARRLLPLQPGYESPSKLI
jgi:hypothetical protein